MIIKAGHSVGAKVVWTIARAMLPGGRDPNSYQQRAERRETAQAEITTWDLFCLGGALLLKIPPHEQLTETSKKLADIPSPN